MIIFGLGAVWTAICAWAVLSGDFNHDPSYLRPASPQPESDDQESVDFVALPTMMPSFAPHFANQHAAAPSLDTAA